MLSILFSKEKHRKRIFYTFCPRFILKLDPFKNRQKDYWKSRDSGDAHGYDKYEDLGPEHTSALFKEIETRLARTESILDLGCNCGYILNVLKKRGYAKLSGIDICRSAVEYGKKKFGLDGIDLNVGSYETVLPRYVFDQQKFDLVFSGGASIALVHPSFDIIKHICAVSRKYVILIDEDSTGFPYPRLWDYEFSRNSFTLVKFLRPSSGLSYEPGKSDASSLAVYQRIEGL